MRGRNRTKEPGTDERRGIPRILFGCVCLGFAFLGCAGCGARGQEITEPAAEGADYEEIVMTLQTLDSSVLDGLAEVTEAVNAITVPEIGVKVSFRTVDATEAFTEYPLWLSNGESIDLMILNYIDITSYINKGDGAAPG